MHARLCEIVDAHVTGKAHAPGGIAQDFEEGAGARPKLAMIGDMAEVKLFGVVGKRVGSMEKSSGVMDVDDMVEDIETALEDDRVRGIMLDVNSPGGTVTGVPEAADIITEAAKIKPIVAFTDTLMASAAYWIACGADAIVATDSSNVGSIGVFSAILDSSAAYNMAGMKQQLFKEGKYKAMGIAGLPLTEDQKEHIQARTTMLYEWFTSSVVEARGIVGEGSFEGQTFRGSEAKARNLIDQVGDKEAAYELLQEIIINKA
jgi:signal peptide peptidase SppA